MLRKWVILILMAGIIGVLCGRIEAQYLSTTEGPVDFVGFSHLNPLQVEREILSKSRKTTIHWCREVLKDYGLNDTAVFITRQGDTEVRAVYVIEPQNEKQIRYSAPGTRWYEVPRGWQKLYDLEAGGKLANNFLNYGSLWIQNTEYRPTPEERTAWDSVQSIISDADFHFASLILSNSSNAHLRAVAAVVLLNFASRDECWHLLIHALRDSENSVRVLAYNSVFCLTKYATRKIDWKSATEDLRDLLNGTNLPVLPQIYYLLDATSVSPDLAPQLLTSENRALILGSANVHFDFIRVHAVGFLNQLASHDLRDGEGRAKWFDGILRRTFSP